MQYISNLANAMIQSLSRDMQNEMQWYDAAWSEIGQASELTVELDIGRNARVNIPRKTGRNQGTGYRNEATSRGGTALPTAGAPSYGTMYATLGYLYGAVNITGPTLAVLGQGPPVQAVNLITDQFDDIRDGMGKDMARSFWAINLVPFTG